MAVAMGYLWIGTGQIVTEQIILENITLSENLPLFQFWKKKTIKNPLYISVTFYIVWQIRFRYKF